MLFYGITLIMKEKSNASALRPRVDDLYRGMIERRAASIDHLHACIVASWQRRAVDIIGITVPRLVEIFLI